MIKRRMSTEQMQDVLRQLTETDFAEQTYQHYQNEAQRVLKEEGAPEDALSTHEGLTPRARDAIEILDCIKAARANADNGRFGLAQAHAAKMGAMAMQAHMRLFELDVALGQNRRQQQQDFARKGRELYQEERDAHWDLVLEAAQRLVDADHELAKSKTRLAKEVQKSFGLFDAISTIRKKLKDIKPTPIK